MIYNDLYDLEGFIRINTLNDLKTKNFNFKENDIVFVIENFTFYTIKNVSEETNTLGEIEVNSNFKGIKLFSLINNDEIEKIISKVKDDIKQLPTQSFDETKPIKEQINKEKVKFVNTNLEINSDTNNKDLIIFNTSKENNKITAFGINKDSLKLNGYILRSDIEQNSWAEKCKLWHSGNFDPESKIDKNTEYIDNIGIVNKNNGSGIFLGSSNEINFLSHHHELFFNYKQIGSVRIDTFVFSSGESNTGKYAKIKCGNIESSGDITGTRVFNAVWNDYAEFFPKKKETITEPGDIIALDENSNEECYVKATNFHSVIVGVHSDEFGHLIGGKQPKKNEDYLEINKNDFIPIGLAGRVKVKFRGIAKKGMRVVPSDVAGVGRKYNPKIDSQDHIIGYIVENNFQEGIKKVKIKIK